MKKFSITLLALATALAISPAAKADTFSYGLFGSGLLTGQTGSLTLTGNSLGGGVYNITDGSITFDGFTGSVIPNVPPTSTSLSSYPNWTYDDVLRVGPNGILFGSADNVGGILFGDPAIQAELWSEGGADYFNILSSDAGWAFDANDYPYGQPVNVTPEPSSLLLLGTGLFGLAFVAFRKAKSTGAFQIL